MSILFKIFKKKLALSVIIAINIIFILGVTFIDVVVVKAKANEPNSYRISFDYPEVKYQRALRIRSKEIGGTPVKFLLISDNHINPDEVDVKITMCNITNNECPLKDVEPIIVQHRDRRVKYKAMIYSEMFPYYSHKLDEVVQFFVKVNGKYINQEVTNYINFVVSDKPYQHPRPYLTKNNPPWLKINSNSLKEEQIIQEEQFQLVVNFNDPTGGDMIDQSFLIVDNNVDQLIEPYHIDRSDDEKTGQLYFNVNKDDFAFSDESRHTVYVFGQTKDNRIIVRDAKFFYYEEIDPIITPDDYYVLFDYPELEFQRAIPVNPISKGGTPIKFTVVKRKEKINLDRFNVYANLCNINDNNCPIENQEPEIMKIGSTHNRVKYQTIINEEMFPNLKHVDPIVQYKLKIQDLETGIEFNHKITFIISNNRHQYPKPYEDDNHGINIYLQHQDGEVLSSIVPGFGLYNINVTKNESDHIKYIDLYIDNRLVQTRTSINDTYTFYVTDYDFALDGREKHSLNVVSRGENNWYSARDAKYVFKE